MSETKYVGPSFCSLLTLLFIGLKLGGAIDWSWWWVLCPIWIPTMIVIVSLLILFGMVLTDHLVSKRNKNEQ